MEKFFSEINDQFSISRNANVTSTDIFAFLKQNDGQNSEVKT